MEAAPHPWPALGVLLMRDGLVSKDEIEEVLGEQHDARMRRISSRRLGEILIQRGRVTPTQVARLVAEQYELPFAEFEVDDVDRSAAAAFREEEARRFSALPIRRDAEGTFVLAMADPSTVLFSEDLRVLLGSVPHFVVGDPDVIERAIDSVYGSSVPVSGSFEQPEPGVDARDGDAIVFHFPPGGPTIPVSEPVGEHDPNLRPLIGALLVRGGFLTDADLDTALAQQRLTPSYRLGEILVEKGVVTPAQVAQCLAEQYELAFVDLDTRDVDAAVARVLDEALARSLFAVPFARDLGGRFEVAVADPTHVVHSDALRNALDGPLSLAVAAPDAIARALDRIYRQDERPGDAERLQAQAVDAWAVEAEDPVTRPIAEAFEALATGPAALWPLDLSEQSGEAAGSMLDESEATQPEAGELGTSEPDADEFEPSDLDAGELELSESEVSPFAASESGVLAFHDEPDSEPDARLDAEPDERVHVSDEPAWTSRLELVDEVAWDDDVADPLSDALAPQEFAPDEPASGAEEAVSGDVFDPVFLWPLRPVEAAAEPSDEDGADAQVLPFEGLPYRGETQDELARVSGDEFSSFETTQAASNDAGVQEPKLVPDAVEFEGVDADLEIPEALEDGVEPDGSTSVEVEHASPFSFAGVEVEVADEPFALDHPPKAFEEVEEVVEVNELPEMPEPADERETNLAEMFEAVDEREPDVAEMLEAVDEPEADVAEVSEAADERETNVAGMFEAAEEPEADIAELVRPAESELARALAAGAEVVHFTPEGDGFAVRARIDGVVRDAGTVAPEELEELVAALETTEGARTNVVETAQGPKTTVFRHGRPGAPATLDELGPGSDVATALRAALARDAGVVLVCGPARSGRTTTIHAALVEASTPERVIASYEHPVERVLAGVDQIAVDPANGSTYAAALHELRSTDPDAVAVGELDRESAELAFRAADDGRLVLAGWSAPGAVAGVRRLLELGLDSALVARTLECVVAQDLVRTVCRDCRETYYASDDELAALGESGDDSPRLLARGRGCASCDGSGFWGRVGIFEVLAPSDDFRELVAETGSAKKLQRAAVASGMRTLADEAIRLCLEGSTTVGEVERVLAGR